jgi:hypothetical protein
MAKMSSSSLFMVRSEATKPARRIAMARFVSREDKPWAVTSV